MLVRCALAWLLAAAQEPTPDAPALDWSAPPECPDRAAFQRAIARRLTDPDAAAEARTARIAARVVRDGPRYTLHLRLAVGPRSETRELHDASCTALVDAAAVRVAAALAPSSALVPTPPPAATPGPDDPAPDAPAPDPPDAPDDPATPATPLAPATPRTPAPAPDEPTPQQPGAPGLAALLRPPGGLLRLHGGAELGALPGPTGALGLAGGLLWPRLRLELHGTFLAPRTASAPQGSIQVLLVGAALHACARLGRGALEVPLCLGVEAGAMRGAPRGLAGSTATNAWLAAVLGAGVSWHVAGRLGVWAALQLVLAPVHPRFELRNSERAVTLFNPAVASGRLLLGVELRLRDPW